MKKLSLVACASLATLLSACGTPHNGYYDEYGRYVPPTGTETDLDRANETSNYYQRKYRQVSDEYEAPAYTRAGYYDYRGYYIPREGAFSVPANMFPPRGMCRVWFPDRSPAYQPAVESCDGISYRVPAGAYVIYGG